MEDKNEKQSREKKDTKVILVRMLQIMETTDERTPMNSKAINDALEREYQLPRMDRKTISDTMTTLMSCGYPIKQVTDKRKGWYMADHKFEDWELKLMMDAVQQARFVSETEAKEIRQKLLSVTSNRGRSRFAHLMDFTSGNVATDYHTGEILEDLLEAIYLNQKIEFQYTEIDNNLQKIIGREGHKYLLSPYAIYWAENNYYLIGAHDQYDKPSQYRLDRIVNLRITKEKSVEATNKLGPNPEKVLQEFVDQSVNHFSGEVVRLEVEYEPSISTNRILYDFVGKDAKVRQLENGRCVASFRKMESPTLIGWFMQYGTRFKLLAPEKVRNQVKMELQSALQEYGVQDDYGQ